MDSVAPEAARARIFLLPLWEKVARQRRMRGRRWWHEPLTRPAGTLSLKGRGGAFG